MGAEVSAIKDFAAFRNNHTPIVGQPFTLEAISVPCNAQLRCNCGGEHVTVDIKQSVAAACPSCGKSYNALFNPTTNSVEFRIAVPEPPKVV